MRSHPAAGSAAGEQGLPSPQVNPNPNPSPNPDQDYKGLAWLFLGVANSDALLYDDEWQPIVKNFPDNFKLDYALSREQKNKSGGKMYIQDKVTLTLTLTLI